MARGVFGPDAKKRLHRPATRSPLPCPLPQLTRTCLDSVPRGGFSPAKFFPISSTVARNRPGKRFSRGEGRTSSALACISHQSDRLLPRNKWQSLEPPPVEPSRSTGPISRQSFWGNGKTFRHPSTDALRSLGILRKRNSAAFAAKQEAWFMGHNRAACATTRVRGLCRDASRMLMLRRKQDAYATTQAGCLRYDASKMLMLQGDASRMLRLRHKQDAYATR